MSSKNLFGGGLEAKRPVPVAREVCGCMLPSGIESSCDEPKPDDGPGVSKWRQRTRSEESREIYEDRAATAERPNADSRCHRGLDAMRVRGIDKVPSVMLWAALAFDVMRCMELELWQ